MRSLVLHNSLYGDVQLVLNNAITVIDVKDVISLYFGIKTNEIILIFRGSILRNDQILLECGIQEKSKVYGVFKTKIYPYVFERYNKYCMFTEEEIRMTLHRITRKHYGCTCTEEDIEEKILFLQHPQGLTELSKISDKQQAMAEYKAPKLAYRVKPAVEHFNTYTSTVIPDKTLHPNTDPLPTCFKSPRKSVNYIKNICVSQG